MLNIIYNITGYIGFFFLISSHYMLSQGKWANNDKKYLYFNIGACIVLLINSILAKNYAFMFFNTINSLPVLSILFFNEIKEFIKNKINLFLFLVVFSSLSFYQMVNNNNFTNIDYFVTILGTITSFCFYLTFLLMMNKTIKVSTLVIFYTVYNSLLLYNSLHFDYLFGIIPQAVFLLINAFSLYKHFILKQNINLVGSETEIETGKY